MICVVPGFLNPSLEYLSTPCPLSPSNWIFESVQLRKEGQKANIHLNLACCTSRVCVCVCVCVCVTTWKCLLAAAAAKSLQSCPTLCNPIDSSPLGSSVPGILQARILEWVAIAFSKCLLKGMYKASYRSNSFPTVSYFPQWSLLHIWS